MTTHQTLLFATVAAIVVAVDQSTKAAAQTGSVVRNPAYALGVGHGSAFLLAFGTIAVLGMFIGVLGRWTVRIGVSPAVPALLAGGMLANTLDRVRLGAVRDFIHTPWLVVNVADIAVAVGIITTAVYLARVATRLPHAGLRGPARG
ncbi:MAG TPA: signal peptidase II [Acidimicrobiia bacterium]|nr:signal peptidase II [Acidimicrobiia bacterium]